jgi:hypothetical protein
MLGVFVLVNIPLAASGQLVQCELQRQEHVGFAGVCDREGPKPVGEPSRRQLLSLMWPDSTVPITVRPSDTVPGVWDGTFSLSGWELPFELVHEAREGRERVVLRSELAWVVVSTWTGSDDDRAALSFDALDYPLASDLDDAILRSALRRTREDLVWDRKDDRECEDDELGAISLSCILAAAIEDEAGAYYHRQPALEIVRQVIRENWPDRLSGHPVMDFNNHPDTTWDDLSGALEHALELVRSEISAQRERDRPLGGGETKIE